MEDSLLDANAAGSASAVINSAAAPPRSNLRWVLAAAFALNMFCSHWSRDSLACRLYSLALEVWDRPRKEFHFATEKLASSLLTAAGFDLFSLGGESPHTPLLLFLAS